VQREMLGEGSASKGGKGWSRANSTWSAGSSW
jgi:hypothetical protein